MSNSMDIDRIRRLYLNSNLRFILRIILTGGGGVFGELGGRYAAWTLTDARLPYNEAGRYFDSVEMVVHHQDNLLGLSMIAAGFFAAALVLLCFHTLLKKASGSHS